MQLSRTPLGRARAAVAVTSLAAVVVVLAGAFTVAGLMFHGATGPAAIAAGVVFAGYFLTSRMAFDALDRLGDVREQLRERQRPAAPTGTAVMPAVPAAFAPTRLASPAQDPGRHRPETFAQTHALPAVAPAGARS